MKKPMPFNGRNCARLAAAAIMILVLSMTGGNAFAQAKAPLPAVPAVPPAPGSPAVETDLPPNAPVPPQIKKKVEAILSQVKDKAVYVEERRFRVTDETLIFDINDKPAKLTDLVPGTKVLMVFQAMPAPRDPICHELRVKKLPVPAAPTDSSNAGPRNPKSAP